MAEPFDSATFLEDVSALAQTQYFPKLITNYAGRFGGTFNRLFDPSEMEVTGVGKVMQTEIAPADTVRMNTDPLGAFAAPDSMEPTTLTVRFNKQTTASNDFSEISASCQTDDIDLQEAGKGSIVDFVERMVAQVMPNFDEHLSILRQLPRTALLGVLSGAVVARNDHIVYASATATASNANGLRAILSSGSIAALRRGTRIDLVNPTTGVVNAGNVRITDTNPSDLSFGVEFVSTGIAARQSTGSLAAVGTADQVYFSNEKNKGIYSVGAYFTRPAATGDSFIGGVDRMASANRYLNPTSTREGLSPTPITKSMFDDLAIAMGFRDEDEMAMVCQTAPGPHQTIRTQLGEDSFIQIPTDDSRSRRFGNFGSVGLNYQHGQFGIIKVVSDPLCPPTVVRFLKTSTWKSLYYGWKGLRQVPGDMGGWYRLNEAAPNTGRGKIVKCDWYALMCDFCTQPQFNGQILNISP